MSGPRTKRQFAGAASDPAQRQITSFFSKTSSSTTSADAAAKSSNQGPLNGPALPSQVQTDLLNVGMRVRKAIPEGYKTGSAYSAFTLWAEDSTSNSSYESRAASAATTTRTTYPSAMRELEPFCGLNRVGGLAFQPANNIPVDEDMDAMPGLTSSQDTILTTTSTSTSPSSSPPVPVPVTTTTRKRIFASDEDEAAHSALATSLPYRGPFRLSSDSQSSWLDDEEISPRSLAPPPGLWETARLLAVPRRPKQQQQQQQQHHRHQQGEMRKVEGAREGDGGLVDVAAVGQENVMVVVQGKDGDDFEEAGFLDYGLTGDVRMEIE
ncbi:hypothetical protein C8A00DRAFT_31853 [Chaetomidium leptoderma]|uniref:Uncharacterized protein n=1 Tax=Chaetomidium leptoderma TaxID=669021 RepID=A0AAN6VPD0_9PEZI|nr:hypothetical protein C8A00DRAFT_31853 [Chaetomidium leptoderma]